MRLITLQNSVNMKEVFGFITAEPAKSREDTKEIKNDRRTNMLCAESGYILGGDKSKTRGAGETAENTGGKMGD